MSILSGLKEALTLAKEAQTLPVLRERLALAQEQMVVAEKKYKSWNPKTLSCCVKTVFSESSWRAYKKSLNTWI